MTDRIILDIHHSDDYTDYLFLTASLTDKRIIPMIDPSPAEIKAQSGANTLVLGCYNSRREPGTNAMAASYDEMSRNLHVLSKCYLEGNGTVNATQAEMARSIIHEKLNGILYSSSNLHEVYRRNFPLFWRKRDEIYANPLLFYAKTGMLSSSSRTVFPLGVMLKTIEGNEDLFRTKMGGGCHCEKAPLLIDYNPNDGDRNSPWTLYTWCPRCSSRREVMVGYVGGYESRIEAAYSQFNKKHELSALTLFDVVDTLSNTNLCPISE